MIVDNIANFEFYKSLNPYFEEVLKFIKNNKLSELTDGKHIIDGDKLFVNINTTAPKTKDEAKIEYHRKYIDIQIPLNINETYGYTPLVDLPEADFDEKKDIAKLPAGYPCRSYITATPSDFVIFFPQDGHAPCIADGTIHKAIFKVAVE